MTDQSHSEIPLILLIGDDPAAVTEFVRALGHNGAFEVMHTTSGPAAVEHLSRLSRIECVVCGINTHSNHVLEMVRLTKVLRPSIPVLLIVPRGGRQVNAGLAAARDDVLVRPFTPSELRSRVARNVKRGRQMREVEARTVLVVGAHPDDMEIGVGGTLLGHVASGSRVVQLMMTDGEAGGSRSVRVVEAKAAAKMLGSTLVRGKVRDASVSSDAHIVETIDKVVDTFRPSVVYVHSSHDTHQDHRATHWATLSAVRDIASVYGYQSPSTTVDFRPSRFVDIGDYLDAKIALIEVFRSQVRTRLYLNEDLIRASARYWGRHAGHRLVEPLEVIRQLAP
ncbi:MAG: PIG-L family deacetylase [bacterium]